MLGEARQTFGRFVAVGFFSFVEVGTCDGSLHRWSATVAPEAIKFGGGKTMTVTFVFSCGAFECASDYVEQTVMLRGGGK